MKPLKPVFILCLTLLSSFFFLNSIYSQSSGKNPEYILYKHYYDLTNSVASPVINVGDSIGTIRFNAMTAYHHVMTGASIRSMITGPFNGNTLPANLIFRTGADKQYDRMAITSDGLVGIGTLTPEYNLHTVGNTHTSGDFFGRLHIDNFSATDDAPDSYIDEVYFERKLRNVLSLPLGLGSDGGLMTLAPGGSSFDHQLFFADDGIFVRRTSGNTGNWAGANWHKLLSGEDINGTINQLAKFTGPNSLGDSRLFDNGAQIGIATTTPALGFLLDINGNTQITGNGNVSGHLTAATAHVDGKVSIATTNTTGGHELYVGGSIVAEEVVVKLQTNWPDYVFDKNYPQPDLKEWQKFIATHHRLPGMPSATEVQKNGLELGETQRLLLEKIEQLTLILLEQQKQIDALKAAKTK